MFSTKIGAVKLSLLSNTLLIIFKITVGLLIGSVAVVAEALHSGMDLMAAIIAYFSVRIAGKPPDRGHPFGHGKAENISGTAEALLIFAAAALIIYEAAKRLIVGGELGSVDLGLAVMATSAVVNTLVSRHLLKVARATDSVAVEADARHLTTDVYTSLGVLAGLAVVRITGYDPLDPIIAILVALLIFRTAFVITRKAFGGLMDIRLPPSEEAQVEAIIKEHYGALISFHDLRTRKAGSERFILLHLVVNRELTVAEAHRISDHLEEEIRSRLPACTITIHIEPPEAAPP